MQYGFTYLDDVVAVHGKVLNASKLLGEGKGPGTLEVDGVDDRQLGVGGRRRREHVVDPAFGLILDPLVDGSHGLGRVLLEIDAPDGRLVVVLNILQE